MDIFDALSIFGETYINTKKDVEHSDDCIEAFFNNFLKTKSKIDKMYDDEINKRNKTGEATWELID